MFIFHEKIHEKFHASSRICRSQRPPTLFVGDSMVSDQGHQDCRVLATAASAPVRSSAARAAHRELALAPTFVSGQLFLGDLRANALAHGAISRSTNKAVARAYYRRYWPETGRWQTQLPCSTSKSLCDLCGSGFSRSKGRGAKTSRLIKPGQLRWAFPPARKHQ